MRKIKFRGKALQDFDTNIDGVQQGDWVYGFYYYDKVRMIGVILTTLCAESGGVGNGLMQVEIEVDTDTVGQFTGFQDKKGMTDIYEGDILRFDKYVKTMGEIVQNFTGEVVFEKGMFKFNSVYLCCQLDGYIHLIEVIGNIYENTNQGKPVIGDIEKMEEGRCY
jgi:YopX protein